MKKKLESQQLQEEISLALHPMRKRKTKIPCLRCRMHLLRCICNAIPILNLKTRLTLIIHYKELKRTTNTGTLALEALTNSRKIVRGQLHSKDPDENPMSSDYENLLLFPGEDSNELNFEFIKQFQKPINLIVPDGNWRQASKVQARISSLKDVPKVMFRKSNLAGQHLRAENTSFGMSTLESIARALGVIEGANIEESLMKLYTAKLQATIVGRGQKIQDF